MDTSTSVHGPSPADHATPPLPREFAGAANLMLQPLAGMAAMSALGFAFASQALNMWAGALANAAAAPQQRRPAMPDAFGPVAGDGSATNPAPPVQSKPAAVTSIAEARAKVARLARSEAMPKPSFAAQKPAATAASSAAARPRALVRPQKPDDLKVISGIGPKLEQVLNGLGTWTYAQIAAWAPAEVTWVEDHLGFAGRIGRDDWIGQPSGLPVGRGPDAMHLAQLNIAKLKYPIDDPQVADFVDNLDRVNAVAERSPGFVWRFVDNGSDIGGFDDPMVIVNMSVWTDAESLEHFVWNTAHKRIYSRRSEWFGALASHHFVMWWVDDEHVPSVREAQDRLALLDRSGNSDEAFDWAHLPGIKLWQSQRCA